MKLNEIAERKASNLDEVRFYRSGDLDISYSSLTSFEGCPKIITGDFRCVGNNFTTFNGCPEKIESDFRCAGNLITTFEGCPKIVGSTFFISQNRITSFKDIDKHIEHIGGKLFARREMNITSGFSDLFGIDGLEELNIDNKDIENLVNKYLPSNDRIEFQDEMIKAGYESFL